MKSDTSSAVGVADGLSRRRFLFMAAAASALPALAACGSSGGSPTAGKTTELTFLFPVGVSGPLTTTMSNMVDDFNKSHRGIRVKASFTGGYDQTVTKVQTALKGGARPDVVLLNMASQQTFLDLNGLEPLDDLADKYGVDLQLSDFYPGLLADGKSGGKLYGLSFQRSTALLYYNKSALQEAGFASGPHTWDDVVAAGTRIMGARTTKYGVEYPVTVAGDWLFQGLAAEAGQPLTGQDQTHVNFNSDAAVTALSWVVDLSSKYKIMPSGAIDWLATPTDFAAKKTAMAYHSSGSLTSILQQSHFDVGAAFLPKQVSYGTPTGGGAMYIIKGIPEENQRAALTFVQWMTSAEQVARWAIGSGYVPCRKAAASTQAWRDYVAKRPQAQVPLDQLSYSVPAVQVHQATQVNDYLRDSLEAAVTHQASPQDALNQAQKNADSVLSQFR